jgi:UDP-N-acetylglucosamine--N-acetylmuramyl-(pentapeptide) pyrophosphoryl-undecaprenol N-acetylglucosamine transferase
VLITGGSQGARILSETAPRALAALPEAIRSRLKVHQQSRPETLEAARQIYLDAAIDAEVAPFFRDMAQRLSAAHLVIGRAGASTCSELAVAALPSILIPLKIAMDDHQRFNAASLADAGGAEVLLEDEVTVERLTTALTDILGDPARLAAMSRGARATALPDATASLADRVEAAAPPV